MNDTPKCDICGKFIASGEFLAGSAQWKMLEPDSEFGPERWESLHRECEAAASVATVDRRESLQGSP